MTEHHESEPGLSGPVVAPEELRQALAEDVEAQQLLVGIRDARQRRDLAAERELVSLMQARRDALEIAILHQQGEYVDPSVVQQQRERQRLDRLAVISEHLTGEETPEELLHRFGLLDGDDKATIDSPLFRDETKHAFAAYLDAVRQFDGASRVEQQFGQPTRRGAEANTMRQQIHDMVAEMIAADLSVPFDDGRRLAAKIRDGAIPNSGENRAYLRGIAKQLEKWDNDIGEWSHQVAERFQRRFDRGSDTTG